MGKGGVGAVIGFVAGAALSFIVGPAGTAVWLKWGIKGAAIGYTLMSEADSPTYRFGEIENTRSNVLPIPIIYGEHKVGGNVIYERISDDEKKLYLCVAVGEGEVEDISNIEVNGTPIEEIKGVTYTVYRGTADQGIDSRVTSNERFPNTAYIAFTFTANDQVSSTPNITCVVKGRKVRVWENNRWITKWSNNPAWCVLDFLTNSRYGLGKDDGVIDLNSFIAEAAYCDELVEGANRFELDFVVDYEQSSLDILSTMLSSFRANLLYSDGQLRLKIEKSELPVQAFNMDNIVQGSFWYQKDSLQQIPNQVIGQFADRDKDWEMNSVIYDNDIDQTERGVLGQTLTMYGITRASQAGRMVRYFHDLSRLCDTFCEFSAGIDAIHCEAGDVITVSHDVPGWEGKEFLIVEMQESEDDTVVLRCREYNSAIYHDKGSKYQPPEAPALPNPLEPPPSVLNLVLSEAHKQLPDGTWVPQIRATWDIPNTISWKSAHVWLSDDGGANWIYVNEVEGTSTHIDVVGTGEYRVRIVSENRRGVREDFGLARTSAITIIGKQAKPPNVTWADCSFVHNVALSWLPVDAKDIAGYEIRTVDDGWGSHNEQLIYKGTETKHSFTPTQRNYTFYVKAFDRHGNYSEVATAKSLSLLAPEAPPQPEVKQFFRAVQIGVRPLNNPAILGYNIYITEGAEVVKIPALVGGFVTYSAPPGTVLKIQVAGYDVIGEGTKSEILQATTTALSELDIPDNIIDETKLTESLRQAIEENDLGDIPHRLEIVEADLDAEIEGSVKSQVLQLANEITLKVQRKTNGELVVTGIGVAIDDQGESEVAVLADRFRILGDVEGESQPVFAVDTQTQKIYILGDLIAEGLIRATEVQAEVAKALLMQAELGVFDEIHGLRIKADKITVGGSASLSSGIPLPKPSGAHVWHYDKHLSSTDGIRPTSVTGAVVVGGKGVAGGALRLSQGDSVVYELSNPVTSFTWAGFYEEG